MLIEPFLASAQSQPDDLAVIDDSGPHTYGQLAAWSASMCHLIAASTSRDTVGIMLPSSAGFVASFYGTLWAGKSVVPINFLLSPREIAHVIADSGIDTVITLPVLAAKIKDLPLKVIDISALQQTSKSSTDDSGLQKRTDDSGLRTQRQEIPESAASSPPPLSPQSSVLSTSFPPLPARRADDMAVLMYTSGTSGLPKGVILSYGNLQSDVDAAIQHADLQHRHKFLGIIPLFHSFGMTACMIAPMQLGSSVTYMARFNATAAIKTIREQAMSLVFAIPSMYAAILFMKSAGPDDFKSVYACLSGGEPLPAAVAAGFLQRFGVAICEGYGLTETSPVVSINVPQSRRTGSVGRPIPGVKVRLVDDDGNDAPPGQSGEIWLGGPMIMKGYHHLPTETAAALTPDGFFKTGDLGHLDPDGYLYVVGRKKDLIIVAGEKAVPREIEDILQSHAAVAESAVVGKKDPSRGEVVVAFVTLREGQTATPEAIRQHCRDAGLPQWKIPREIFIETDLPRSPTGKVLKRLLRDRVNATA